MQPIFLMFIFLVKNKFPLLNFSVFLYILTGIGAAHDCNGSAKISKPPKDDTIDDAIDDDKIDDAMIGVMNEQLNTTHQVEKNFRSGFAEALLQSLEQSLEGNVPPEQLPVHTRSLESELPPRLHKLISQVLITTQKLSFNRPKHFINYYNKEDADYAARIR